MLLKLGLLFIGTIVAFWLSAICGGGASLILIPILNLFLPTSVVPFSLTIGTVTSSVSRIAVFKKSIRWKIFFWFVPFSIPAVVLGAYLIKYINPNYLQLIVALFLLSNLPQLLKSKKKENEHEAPYPKWILALIGFMAGFVSGITGAIGLLFNRFYLKYGLTKEQIVATRAANEVFLHAIKLVIYISLGLYSKLALWLGLAIAVATIVSSYTVKYILPYLSEHLFKKIGYAAMVVSGLFLLGGTSDKIVKQDHISFSTQSNNGESISIVHWRHTNLVMEYSIDGNWEIERPIAPDELPPRLKEKHRELKNMYDTVYIEKVFAFRKDPAYEFHCLKDSRVTKLTL